jgi:5-methyltetrahydropteroyltriglutamate--homocysteine methyltransferase
MNAASPGVINVFMPNKFYKDDDEYLEKLSEVMSPEYKLITDNNIHLQLDCPDLALARHMNYKDLSEEEFLIRAEMQIEALNNALIGIPAELVRMHICWGNYEGPHTFDIGLEKILPVILKANLKYLLIESSNPRHSHEWQVFDEIELPKDKVVVPGVIDSTSNFVEHPQVVADRLIQFSKVIPKDQLMAGTDCGFSTFAGFGKIDEDICYAKLNSLVEGAALASKLI